MDIMIKFRKEKKNIFIKYKNLMNKKRESLNFIFWLIRWGKIIIIKRVSFMILIIAEYDKNMVTKICEIYELSKIIENNERVRWIVWIEIYKYKNLKWMIDFW